ncbi:flavoprotein [Streptomyces canus]|nr:flavoprotein [Streptomyces canus]WSW41053.1 flavoprotein [Streptomyces canus]
MGPKQDRARCAGRSAGRPTRSPPSWSPGGVGKLIDAAQERDWDIGVVATPQGLGFLDTEAIEAQTSNPIRSAWRARRGRAAATRGRDRGCAPDTFNTVNKWAAGISDALALGILCEAYGMGIPTAVLPYLNSAQAAHPAYRRSLEHLREMDALIGSYEPHRPKVGSGADRYRWMCPGRLTAPLRHQKGRGPKTPPDPQETRGHGHTRQYG